jgi:hypothetical protein
MKTGHLEVIDNNERYNWQKQGNAQNWQWFVVESPCLISFFKRKKAGETAINSFKLNYIVVVNNEIEIIETVELDKNLITLSTNFISFYTEDCLDIDYNRLFYLEFTTNNFNVYKTSFICLYAKETVTLNFDTNKNGYLEVIENSQKWNWQKQGSYQNWQWNFLQSPCLVSFYKRKKTGETSITSFKLNYISVVNNEVQILETKTLNPALIDVTTNFFALESKDCLEEDFNRIFYLEFTTNLNTTYKTGFISLYTPALSSLIDDFNVALVDDFDVYINED